MTTVAERLGRHSDAAGKAWIDAEMWVEVRFGVFRIASAQGVLLVSGDHDLEAAKQQFVSSLLQPALEDDEATEEDEGGEPDGAEPFLERLAFSENEPSAPRGAWPASDDAETSHFEDTVGDLEEELRDGPIDDLPES